MCTWSALWNLQHEGCGRERDKARAEGECFIITRDRNPECCKFHNALHVHINCCIVTLNVAKHYHGNIDDAFDLFLNFARCMDSRAHVHDHAILSLYCTRVHYEHYIAGSRDQLCCTCCNASAFSLICPRKSQYLLLNTCIITEILNVNVKTNFSYSCSVAIVYI